MAAKKPASKKTPQPDYKQMATDFARQLGMTDRDLRRLGLID